MFTIPVAPGIADQSFTTTLDGRRFRVGLRWNSTAGAWHISLATADGETLVASKALRYGADVLAQLRSDDRAPQGNLFILDTAGMTDPDLDTLGARHRLVYLEAV